MFKQYEPIVKATLTYLKLLKVKVNSNTVNDTLQQHPDYPSLLSITDAFNRWNIPSAAIKIDTEQIDQMATPFMLYTNNIHEPLVIVTHVSDTAIEFYANKFKEIEVQNKEEFFENRIANSLTSKELKGVLCILAEPTSASGEKNYVQNKRKQIINRIVPILSCILLATLSFLFINAKTNSSLRGQVPLFLQYTILLIGVVVSILLLWYEIDRNNPILHKICTGIIKGNCNAILSGKASKVLSWLSWSEVGFFYFAGGFLAVLFTDDALPIVAWMNLLALPYTIFSIYYQGVVAKQWCMFCLTVQALLIAGGVNVFAFQLYQNLFYVNTITFIMVMMLYLLPVLVWYSIKPYLLQLQQAKTTERLFARLKFNPEVFETLLHKQKQITQSVTTLGIDIGNIDAKNTLIKVCSPYCGPCAKAHPKIEKLLEETNNLKAKIIFTATNHEGDIRYKPAAHLLAIAAQGNAALTQQALDDWYLTDKKDYEVFAAKYPLKDELQQQGNKIEAMDKWCKITDIQYTPTIFINGHQLPDVYDMEDLSYFLLE
jgi:protein-disulfide isomerase